MKKAVMILAMVMIAGLAGRFRARYIEFIPPVQTSFDEVGYIWLGKSLLGGGVPMNWSALDIYRGEEVREWKEGVELTGYQLRGGDGKLRVRDLEADVDGYRSQFRLVQPYLDNPPLFGLMSGVISRDVSVERSSIMPVRRVMIAAMALLAGLVLVTAWNLGGWPAGAVAGITYAVGPGFVTSGRMALPENFLGLWLMAVMLLLGRVAKRRTKWWWLVVAMVLVSPLIKVSGLVVGGAAAMYLGLVGEKRRMWVAVAAAVGGFLAYLVYGWWFGGDLMVEMLLQQGNRGFAGPVMMLSRMIGPMVPMKLLDGWIIMGFMGLWWVARKREYYLVTSAMTAQIVFFMLFGGVDYPWYQFMIFPWLAVVVGLMWRSWWKKPEIMFNVLFWAVVVGSMLQLWPGKESVGLPWYRMMVMAVLIIPAGLGIVSGRLGWWLRLSMLAMVLTAWYCSIKGQTVLGAAFGV